MAKFFSHWYNKALAALLAILGFWMFLYYNYQLAYAPPPTNYHDTDSINKMLNTLDNDSNIVTQESTNP
ncbi:MAG: hypothetical protein IJV06_01855 [Bacteroidaceae bacterium]|nr:hypothetical protein [Bacteroidaceae bacterium]